MESALDAKFAKDGEVTILRKRMEKVHSTLFYAGVFHNERRIHTDSPRALSPARKAQVREGRVRCEARSIAEAVRSR